MINLQQLKSLQYSKVFWPIIFTLLLVIFTLKFSAFNANNDVYLQLLSTEGLIKGKGYGFWQDGEFISITSRSAQTRWPPGLTILACIIALMKLDPLVFLVQIYPFLIIISYLTLFYSLKKFLDTSTASIIAFSSLTPLCFFKWYRELASEPFAFVFSVILFSLVINGQKDNNINLHKLFLLILISVILTMIRTAGAYFIPVAFLLYALFWLKGRNYQIKFIFFGILLSMSPILIFHLMSDITSKNKFIIPSSIENISFVSELNNNIGLWMEVISLKLPESILFPYRKEISITLGWIIFVIILLCIKQAQKILLKDNNLMEKGISRVLIAGFGFSFSYILFLSISSLIYSYPWSKEYRVSGFSLPWIILSFYSSLLLLIIKYKNINKTIMLKIVIRGVLLLSIIRYSFACIHAIINPIRDYRETVRDVINAICHNYNNINTVYIYDNHIRARKLLRMLWYSDRYYKKLPWRVVAISKYKPHIRSLKRSVLVIVKEDIKYTETFIKSFSLWKKYTKIAHLEIIIFGPDKIKL